MAHKLSDSYMVRRFDARNTDLVMGKHHLTDDRMTYEPLDDPSSLVIRKLKASDEGHYECKVVYSNRGVRKHKVSLKVIGKMIAYLYIF